MYTLEPDMKDKHGKEYYLKKEYEREQRRQFKALLRRKGKTSDPAF